MDIQIGDRVTYKYLNNGDNLIHTAIIYSDSDLSDYRERLEDKTYIGSIEILKIERPKYEVVEEKKELLTEEEKEYLKNIIKPLKYKSLTIKKSSDNYIKIFIYTENDDCCDTLYLPYIKNFKNLKFENLEESKDYNIEELGLEEN